MVLDLLVASSNYGGRTCAAFCDFCGKVAARRLKGDLYAMSRILSAALSVFLLAPSVWSAIAVDATAPKDQSTASATATSPVFSTSAGQELLVALISTDYLGGANTTVKSISGGGLTWVLVVRTNAQ